MRLGGGPARAVAAGCGPARGELVGGPKGLAGRVGRAGAGPPALGRGGVALAGPHTADRGGNAGPSAGAVRAPGRPSAPPAPDQRVTAATPFAPARIA